MVKKCSDICSHFSRLTFGNFFLCWNQFTLLFDIYATSYFISMALKMFRYWSHFSMITSGNFFSLSEPIYSIIWYLCNYLFLYLWLKNVPTFAPIFQDSLLVTFSSLLEPIYSIIWYLCNYLFHIYGLKMFWHLLPFFNDHFW